MTISSLGRNKLADSFTPIINLPPEVAILEVLEKHLKKLKKLMVQSYT